MEKKREAKKEINSFLLLLGSSAAAALLCVALLLYLYNPSGRYRAGDLLIIPNLFEGQGQFKPAVEVGELEYLYFDKSKGSWKKVEVDASRYRPFYAAIDGDESLLDGGEEGAAAALNSAVRDQLRLDEKGTSAPIFILEMSEESPYYRIALRDSNLPWAYFYHPGAAALARKSWAEGEE